ncbi:tRNA-splicing endonuclease subunit Sen34 isoform X1 [Chiloscyllium plagiosum]|uniref:tRNA-splicing endonuclease subunit Sen34 isoform X1 n=1 Tax=Chiloscyllium plagiosum TaxID=36176 RepID=UPI001CB7E288|nr:tRNA-splicing endonuclease subunit Sen34 isoform X1 [Chiloscyllium plagiosum]
MNWQALGNVPFLLYLLAAKTLLLCLAFAGVKHYQGKRLQARLKRAEEEQQQQRRQGPKTKEE